MIKKAKSLIKLKSKCFRLKSHHQGFSFSLPIEIWLNVPQVSYKGGTIPFRCGIKQMYCLSRLADSCFRPSDVLP